MLRIAHPDRFWEKNGRDIFLENVFEDDPRNLELIPATPIKDLATVAMWEQVEKIVTADSDTWKFQVLFHPIFHGYNQYSYCVFPPILWQAAQGLKLSLDDIRPLVIAAMKQHVEVFEKTWNAHNWGQPLDDEELAAGRGSNELSEFWLRKTFSPVLCIIATRTESGLVKLCTQLVFVTRLLHLI